MTLNHRASAEVACGVKRKGNAVYLKPSMWTRLQNTLGGIVFLSMSIYASRLDAYLSILLVPSAGAALYSFACLRRSVIISDGRILVRNASKSYEFGVADAKSVDIRPISGTWLTDKLLFQRSGLGKKWDICHIDVAGLGVIACHALMGDHEPAPDPVFPSCLRVKVRCLQDWVTAAK